VSSESHEGLPPAEVQESDFTKAQRLFDISTDLRDMVLSYIQENPQFDDQLQGQLGILASKIAGQMYRDTCDLLGIPDSIRQEILAARMED
jgi:hypothetical protein